MSDRVTEGIILDAQWEEAEKEEDCQAQAQEAHAG